MAINSYQNHVVDPTYFWDAIAEFAFDFEWYPTQGFDVDDMGKRVVKYGPYTNSNSGTQDYMLINGSLQSQGTNLNQSKDLNSENMDYNFYCKSVYRIHIGDFIHYKDRYLYVNSVNDYDEWGVRSCSLKMVNLNNHKDFKEYLKYLNGEKIV